MSLQTFDVVLPKSQAPVFPDRCVYSGRVGADASVMVVGHGQNPISCYLSPILLLFGWRSIHAPVQRRFRWKFYLATYGRDTITVALVFLLIFKVLPNLDLDGPFRGIKEVGLVLLLLSPWFAFEALVPRRFAVTVKREMVSYEFTDEAVAREFAEINLGV